MDLVERLAFIVPLASIALVVAITSINVFIRFRRKFAATVNCWFCNENTKVPYDDSNSWDCPHCSQYNGFTEDGDYNREIPAQRVPKLNVGRYAKATESSGHSVPAANGLCEPCNRNQELKMQQLASFEPTDERSFDEEVEAYRRKLDQAYRLCQRCERHLKRTLTRVKQNVLGSKLAEIGAKGLNVFDLHTSAANQKAIRNRKRRLTRLFGATLIVLAIINCNQTTRTVRFTRSTLNLVLPNHATTIVLIVVAALAMAKGFAYSMAAYISNLSSVTVTMNWVGSYWELLSAATSQLNNLDDLVGETPAHNLTDYSSDQWASIAAIMLSMFVVWMNHFRRESVLMLLFWSIKCTLTSAALRSTPGWGLAAQSLVVVDIVQVLVDMSVLIISSQDAFTRPAKPRTGGDANNSSFHRIYADADQLSDESDMETTLSSTRSQNTSRSKYSTRTPLNASINTTRSISPSVFTPSTLRPNMTSSIRSLNRSFCDQSYTPQEFVAPTRPVPPLNRLNNTFNSSPVSALASHAQFQSMQSLNSYSAVPDDFQSGITQLNIGGSYTPLPLSSQQRTASYIGSQTSLNGLSFHDAGREQQMRYRSKSIIGPSRLQPSSTADPGNHKASWVAGGYWNQGTSPTKRTSGVNQPDTRSRDPPLFPIMSRTSSQSSGFESHENGSRESSVGPPNVAAAAFGDPFGHTISPSDSVSQCGIPDYTADPMPSPGAFSAFPGLTGSHAGNGFVNCGPSIGPAHTNGSHAFAGVNSDAFSTFSQQRSTLVNGVGRQSLFGRSNEPQQLPVRWGPTPPIEAGSLLRSWTERNSQLDLRLS